MHNYTYTTLVSSQEYLIAALILNESIKRAGSLYPFLICLTADLATEDNINILKKENINVKIIPVLKYSFPSNGTVDNTASKINVFNLKEYDKILYIDADSLILKNIDHLFEKLDGSILHYPSEARGMSGMFLINPKNHNYNIYKFLIENYNMYDGGIIGHLFFHCISNPEYFIEEKYLFNVYSSKQDINLKEYYGLHFGLSQKPFYKE